MASLAACGDDDGVVEDPSADAQVTTTTADPNAPTTLKVFTTPSTTGVYTNGPFTSKDTQPFILEAVSVGEHEGYVRVVFQFTDGLAGYRIAHATPPFTQDGSGDTVTVKGKGHISVRLTAQAHDEDGKPTVENTTIPGPTGSSVTEIKPLGDFEGVVNYVIGTTAVKQMRVFTLKSPARVVVDIQSP